MFIAVWLVLCGVWFWDWAEALVLLEREEEFAEWRVMVVGKAVVGVGAAGAKTVEQVLSIILLISTPTKWFRCCHFDQHFSHIGDMFENSGLHVVLGLTDVMLAIYHTSCLVDQCHSISRNLSLQTDNKLTDRQTNIVSSGIKMYCERYSGVILMQLCK